MEERKFIRLKKEEFGIKEYIKRDLGKGKISRLDIEYTPVGEKIIVSTSKPGLVIGRRGEKIDELTQVLKKRFKLENPHIEIKEIQNPLFDAQLVADEIAMALERMGNLKFKVIAYKKLQEIMKAGALGCELRISGKLPSERAKSWRFSDGYLKKAGESSKEIDRAQATAITKTGMIGVKAAIMSPTARIYDRIDITDKIKSQIRGNLNVQEIREEKEKTSKKIKYEKPKKEKKSKDVSFSEEKMETKNEDIKPNEDGTAMIIEEEIEEGVPQDIINKELKDKEKNKKTNKGEKTSKGEKE